MPLIQSQFLSLKPGITDSTSFSLGFGFIDPSPQPRNCSGQRMKVRALSMTASRVEGSGFESLSGSATEMEGVAGGLLNGRGLNWISKVTCCSWASNTRGLKLAV